MRKRCAILSFLNVAMGFIAPAGFASETILFNESAAFECYQAALQGGDEYDLDTCTLAIEHQTLSVRDRAATYSNRGLIYARIGEIRAALDDHNQAVRLAPDMGSVYINRSNALVRVKRYERALRDLDKAIEIGDESLAYAYYNRALLFQRLGDSKAARADAERAAETAPESQAYQDFLQSLKPRSDEKDTGSKSPDSE